MRECAIPDITCHVRVHQVQVYLNFWVYLEYQVIPIISGYFIPDDQVRSGIEKMLGNRRVLGIGLGWALVGCTYSLLSWVGCGINFVARFSSSSVSRLLAPAHRHIHQAKPLGEKQATAEPLLQP